MEKAPTVIKAGVKKEEAEELKAKLEAGATARGPASYLLAFSWLFQRNWTEPTRVSTPYLSSCCYSIYKLFLLPCSGRKDLAGVKR